MLATHFHYHQAQVHPGPGPCVCGAVSWQRPEPRNVGAGDAADVLVAVIARRERRIRELCRLWPEGPNALPVRVDQIRRALVEAAPLNSDWQQKLGALHSKAKAETLLREAQEELRFPSPTFGRAGATGGILGALPPWPGARAPCTAGSVMGPSPSRFHLPNCVATLVLVPISAPQRIGGGTCGRPVCPTSPWLNNGSSLWRDSPLSSRCVTSRLNNSRRPSAGPEWESAWR